jgi:hypothetical protein
MIFGLTNSPAVFQRIMNLALGHLRNTIVSCYMDVLLIRGKDWTELLDKLLLVLEALKQAGFTLGLSKREFGKTQLEYIGFDIGVDGIRPGRQKVLAFLKFATPAETTQVHRFHGLTSYFRRFVLRFAFRSELLTRLYKSGGKFYWHNAQESAFQDLKKSISRHRRLGYYDPKDRTEHGCLFHLPGSYVAACKKVMIRLCILFIV